MRRSTATPVVRKRIIDFEIGQLYWNTLKNADGDEGEALKKVKRKYWDEFMEKRDVYLFLGTTKSRHFTATNPFLIIGVYYPPKANPAALFD